MRDLVYTLAAKMAHNNTVHFLGEITNDYTSKELVRWFAMEQKLTTEFEFAIWMIIALMGVGVGAFIVKRIKRNRKLNQTKLLEG